MTTQKERITGSSLWILGIWTFLILAGSASGYFLELSPSFIVPAMVILFIIVLVPYYRENSFKNWAKDFGLRRLTAFHTWRIFAAFIFFSYLQDGELPEAFVHIAGCGDLIIGFLAALAVALPFNVMRYTAFHVLGLVELIIAAWLGMSLLVSGVPMMENIVTLPASLIIFLGVPISAAIHIIALDQMKKAKIAKK